MNNYLNQQCLSNIKFCYAFIHETMTSCSPRFWHEAPVIITSLSLPLDLAVSPSPWSFSALASFDEGTETVMGCHQANPTYLYVHYILYYVRTFTFRISLPGQYPLCAVATSYNHQEKGSTKIG